MTGVRRLRLVVVALTLGGIAGAQPAPGPGPGDDPFARRTDVVNGALSGIQARISEIEVLRADASSKGQTGRTACIDSKLKRAQKALASANTIMSGWSLGKNDPGYAERSTDRMLLMQLYSSIALEEARACEEPKPQTGNEYKVGPNVPTDQLGFDPARPARFDRPPLASPY
jgi:hypothetical protein